MNEIIRELNHGPGFYIGKTLSSDQVLMLNDIILSQFNLRLGSCAPDTLLFNNLSDYHKLSLPISHEEFWSKSARLLDESALKKFKNLSVFDWLKSIFGEIHITGEEGIYSEEVTWRLVRPGIPKDVGFIHADKWFWDINHKEAPKNSNRIKCWIPVHYEPGISGLLIYPGSQELNVDYSVSYTKGKGRPVNPSIPTNIPSIIIDEPEGTPIFFHDNLLHAGQTGNLKTRVSVEFTFHYSQ